MHCYCVKFLKKIWRGGLCPLPRSHPYSSAKFRPLLQTSESATGDGRNRYERPLLFNFLSFSRHQIIVFPVLFPSILL